MPGRITSVGADGAIGKRPRAAGPCAPDGLAARARGRLYLKRRSTTPFVRPPETRMTVRLETVATGDVNVALQRYHQKMYMRATKLLERRVAQLSALESGTRVRLGLVSFLRGFAADLCGDTPGRVSARLVALALPVLLMNAGSPELWRRADFWSALTVAVGFCIIGVGAIAVAAYATHDQRDAEAWSVECRATVERLEAAIGTWTRCTDSEADGPNARRIAFLELEGAVRQAGRRAGTA